MNVNAVNGNSNETGRNLMQTRNSVKPVKPETADSKGINADSFSLSSSLEDIMKQTGASRVTETTYIHTKYQSLKSSTSITGDSEDDYYNRYSEAAYCYRYMERTLTIESDKIEGGVMSITFIQEESYFNLNVREESGGKFSDMIDAAGRNALGGASLEDMRKRIQDMLDEQSRVSAEDYLAAMRAGLEKYNKCAVFLADTFKAERSDFTLDEADYEKLFGRIDADAETYLEKSLKRLETLNDYMRSLNERMSKLMKDMTENPADRPKAKAFSEAYKKLEGCSYKEVSDMADKMFFMKLTSMESSRLDLKF